MFRLAPPLLYGEGMPLHALVLALTLAALPLSGCWLVTHEERSSYYVVWADDDSELAVLRLDYEQELVGDKPGKSRNHRYSVELVDPATMERRVLVEHHRPEGTNPTWPKVYYMKSAGYVLVEFSGVAYMHWLDGETTAIDFAAFSPVTKAGELIPSPSGSLIAFRQYSSASSDAEAGIGILYANDQTIAVDATLFDRRFLSMRWTVDEELVIHGHDGYDPLAPPERTGNHIYWTLTLDGDVVEREEPACNEGPRTSSSDVSADGLRARISPSTGELRLEDQSDYPPFGC
jgi:hypothetical protein